MFGGLAGLGEAVRYLHGPGSPGPVRRLAVVDPALYLLVVAAAFLPPGTLAIAPPQAEGLATDLVFVTGLLSVWVALSERAPAPERAPVDPTPFASLDPVEPGLVYTHRHLTDPGMLLRPQEASR